MLITWPLRCVAMINETRLLAAIRARAESLAVATTGSATLSATATGYARTTGSFIDDGFVVGAEVAPSGFTQTDPGVIESVTALALTINGGRAQQAAGAGRSLRVGLPSTRVYGNRGAAPAVLRWYVTEETLQTAGGRTLLPVSRSRLQENWLSFWTFYGIAGTGDEPIVGVADAFKALFTPATVLDLGDGSTVFVPSDDSAVPKRGQVLPVDGGWARCLVTLQLRGSTRNVVAA